MESNEKESNRSQAIDLYMISAKIFAIGELLKCRGGEPSLDEERVNLGLGEILTDLANEIPSTKIS